MTDDQTGWTAPPRALSLEQLDVLIASKREELRVLEEQAASRRGHAKLEAIAKARNLMRAFDIAWDEVAAPDPAVQAGTRSRHARSVKRVRGDQLQELPTGAATTAAGGPLSRLPSTIRTVLANQGFRTFRDIAQAVDSGDAKKLGRMGPTRLRELEAWLHAERTREQSGKPEALPNTPSNT